MNESLARSVQDNWPHAYARLACGVETFIDRFHCNHIHGVYGNWRDALETVADVLGIEFRWLE